MEMNETWGVPPCKTDYLNTAPMPSEKMLLDLYLKVLFDSFLTEALGQDHHPPLQKVTQGNLAWTSTVFLGNGIQDWVLQEIWAILSNPEKINK
jgi:hypothetical protein